MNGNMEEKNDLIVKWLRILMYAAVASLANSVLGLLPFMPVAVTTWISRGIMLCVVICMVNLATANGRYRTAGILRAVMLGCTLVTEFVYASSIVTLVASVLSIIAEYQEYNAHSELVADIDPKLSGNWRSLFYWSLGIGLLIGLVSSLIVVVMAMMGMDAARSTGIVVALMSVPQLVIEVVYMLYLKKMSGYFRDEDMQF